MGYNTVLVVLNDNVDLGAKDSKLGERILDATRGWHARSRDRSATDIFARSDDGMRLASYGEVISLAHADYSQVVVVGRNTGRPLPECNDLDWYALDQLQEALVRHGYTVKKPKKTRAKV